MMTDTKQPPAATRDRLTPDEQMQDAQRGCAPCALCGGHAIINDAGSGAGYFIRCSNSQIFKASEGCLIEQRRLGGWAYNVMDWWNRLHTAALTSRAGGDAIPAGWQLVPFGEPVSLNVCPPGPFEFQGHLGYRSDYETTLENPRRYQADAYCFETGEYFRGGASGTEARGKLIVQPLTLAAAPKPPAVGDAEAA